MAKKSFGSLMLFSKEKLHYPYKYRLYFIDLNTLKGNEPSIHRFCVRSGKKFEEYELGGIYDITSSGLYIKEAALMRIMDVDEDLYHSLIYLRDLIFMDNRAGKYIGLSKDAYTTSDYYWDYSDYKNIVSYKPEAGIRALYILVKFFMYLFSIVLPIVIYMMILYGFATASVMKISMWTIPSVAIFSLPLLIWMINFIFLMGEMVILNIPSLNMMSYKKYALKWAGMRRDRNISSRTKKEIISRLIFSLICIAICVIINLIV